MNYWTLSKDNIWVAAHRGFSKKYPENTMLAFKEAVALGVDQLELDVHMSKDGELVIIHDKTVDRTTNGTGAVKDMTLAELKALDAGGWKGVEFEGLKIPTFREFMELIKDHPTMTIDVELKVYPTEGQEEYAYDVCDRILAMVDEYGYTDRCVINSWSGKLNERIYKVYGNKYRQHLYYPQNNMGELALEPYSFGYCCCMFALEGVKGARGIATREECDAMREKGISPWAGTFVNCDERIDIAIESGVDLITCNEVDVIMEGLRRRGYHK